MKIKSIKIIKVDTPKKFYDITVNDYHNFSIGNCNVITHNSSLDSAIARLARPFGNSLQILDGYGFFGTEVSPSPAASRYTSVKLSSAANGIINKYSHLTTREPDGPYHPFWVEIPIGLVTPIVGIAVGYKTTVLPRKVKDIRDFLEGRRKNLKPYFEKFNGKIEKYKDLDKAWILSSSVTVEDKKIMVKEIPPILKYDSILKKLDNLINRYESNIRIINNSNTKVNLDIIYTGKNKEEFDSIVNYITKIFSIIVTENLVFIKDGQVLTYDSVEQYLEDYKWQIIRLKLHHTQYERDKLNSDLIFNYAKELFISFILSKKRNNDEITVWLKKYDKETIDKLERLTSRKFTSDELESTKKEITRLKKELKEKEIELKEIKEQFNKLIDPTLMRGVSSRKNLINLFETDDITTYDDVIVWDGQDVYDKDTQNETDVDE